MFRGLVMTMVLVLGFGVVPAMADEMPPDRDVVVGLNEALMPVSGRVGQNIVAVVSGIFPNGCYRWKGVQISQPESDLREVRAVAAVSQGMCIMVLIPFTKEISLGTFTEGEHAVRFVGGDGTFLERKIRIQP